MDTMRRFVLLSCLTSLIALGALAMSGCGSDAVAPQESISITVDEAAVGAALIAFGMVRLFPEFLYYRPAKAAKVECDSLHLIAGEDVEGAVTITFRTLAGDPVCSYEGRPDFGHMYTRGGQQVLARIPDEIPGSKERVVVLTFDIDAEFFRTTTAISGGGTLVAGGLTTGFTVTNATVVNAEEPPNYPVAGEVGFLIGNTPAAVAFLGGEELATLTIGGRTWNVLLDTGKIEEVLPPVGP
jgi:hypothetical protein